MAELWSHLRDRERPSVCLPGVQVAALRSRPVASSLYGIRQNCSLPNLFLKQTVKIIWLIFLKVFLKEIQSVKYLPLFSKHISFLNELLFWNNSRFRGKLKKFL